MAGMSVEAALQEVQEALDVERSEIAQRMQRAHEDKFVEPRRSQLLSPRPCCNCGTIIPRLKVTVMCHLPLELGMIYTSQFIIWCDTCWINNYAHFLPLDQVKDMSSP